MAGELQHFQVRARDRNKNACRRGGAAVAAVLSPLKPRREGAKGRPASEAEQQAEAAASYPVEVLDTGDGLYTVQYRVNQADTYRLAVTMDGEHIEDGPFTTLVEPGASCASRAVVLGDSAHVALAGQLTRVRIRAADCYGNPQHKGGDLFAVTLTRTPQTVLGGFLTPSLYTTLTLALTLTLTLA